MTILGIETSCDETAASVVRDGREVLSSVVFSQIPLHRPYGGVVPEIASRSHLEKIQEVIDEAVARAFPDAPAPWVGIDAIAVTYGPGLASSLIVGLNAAKGLAVQLNKPLVCINHIEAHLHSVFLDKPLTADVYPMLGLVVSGGHTAWIECSAPGAYRILGQTLDDAAGEAFDKAAKLLGLSYPGGPAIDRAAQQATGKNKFVFPSGRVQADNPNLFGMQAELCVSFSGLKTALLRTIQKLPVLTDELIADLAAAYQEAVVSALVTRTETALLGQRYKALVVGGGVSLNRLLRGRLQALADVRGCPLFLAEPKYCGDNAAMIAGLAEQQISLRKQDALALDVVPSLRVGEYKISYD